MIDMKFLTRCIQLANYAKGNTTPNPKVGAVIVHKGRVIGEGYHHKAGQPHAEVMAVRSVQNKELLRESTLYCSLEPCAHHGKTPPCCELITTHNIPRVVIGTKDPHEVVNGQGIAHMRRHGVEVTFAPDPTPFIALNEVFWTNKQSQRPYFTLKWAESKDGFIDKKRDPLEKPASVSGPLAALKTHQLRSEVDGILISGKTAAFDIPSLTTRHWEGLSPVPIVFQSENHPVNDDWLSSLTHEAVVIGPRSVENCIWIQANTKQPEQWLTKLLDLGLCHILVEGGGSLLQFFIDNGLGDDWHKYTAPHCLENGVPAPNVSKAKSQFQLGLDHYSRG